MVATHNFDFSNNEHILILGMYIEVLKTEEELIHYQIWCKILGQHVLTTFVYGLHSVVRQHPLWNSLIVLAEDIHEPWVVIV